MAECVPEQTLVYFHAKDLSALRKAWHETPLYATWTDPRFEAFFRPAKDRLKRFETETAEESRVSLKELTDLFPGELAFFMSDLRYDYKAETDVLYTETNWGFMGRFTGEAQRVKSLVEDHVLKDVPGDARRSVETFRGIDIYTTVFTEKVERPIPAPGDSPRGPGGLSLPDASALEGPEYHYEYAVFDGLCVLLEGQRAYMKTILTHFLDAGDSAPDRSSLAGTENYKEVLRTLGAEPDLLCYVNVQRVLEQAKGNPDYETVFRMRSLRLEELKAAAAGARILDEGLVLDLALSAASVPQGVARFLVADRVNTFRTRKMTPRDVLAYSSGVVDFAGLFNTLRTALAEASPKYGLRFDAAVGLTAQMTQVNVLDLVSRLKGEFATFSRPAAGSLLAGKKTDDSGALLVEIERTDDFAPVLARFVESVAGADAQGIKMTPRSFQGFDLYTFSHDPAQAGAQGISAESLPRFSFAVADSFLILSANTETTEEILRLASGASTENLTRNETFEKAIARLGPGYSYLEWRDMGRTIRETAQLARSPRFGRFFPGLFATEAMPSPDAFAEYFGQWVLAGYSNGNTYRATATLMDPK